MSNQYERVIKTLGDIAAAGYRAAEEIDDETVRDAILQDAKKLEADIVFIKKLYDTVESVAYEAFHPSYGESASIVIDLINKCRRALELPGWSEETWDISEDLYEE